MAPPNTESSEWWAKEMQKGSPLAKRESSLSLCPSPSQDFPPKCRGRNIKQLSWLLLLKAHQTASFLAWATHGLFSTVASIQKRLLKHEQQQQQQQQLQPQSQSQTIPIATPRVHRGKLYKFIRAFLFTALTMLGFELLAHANGWSFDHTHLILMPHSASFQGLLRWTYLSWVDLRANYLAPPLQTIANACIVLFLVQSVDRLTQCLGCLWIKLKRIKPEAKVASLDSLGDVENPDAGYPMVLIQIPMCNEREVYQHSIAAVAQFDWPKDRMLIQVLDDSDDEEVQILIKSEVQKWLQKGIKIVYRHRIVRTGYKAGNLKSAMGCDYVKDYEFVAIFDADFQPKSDFLKKTMIHFKDNEDIGLVQARWSFVNKDENLLTRLQYINLSYHFKVEQQVNGIFLNFFGFNGTSGVWRIKALEESGGWLERTTVEDMDIAVRAHLCGWKFVFLPDVECLCELPEGYEAYRKQQHRWHSGPMQLFRLCLPSIISSKISRGKKMNLIFLFFLLRKLILPFYSFTLFCIILPMTMFIPEAELPAWVVCYVPAVMSLLNILAAPKSFPFIVPYLLFENTMSVTKFNAMVSGLFQLGSAYEWVVTKKTGRASETDLVALAQREVHAEQEALLHLHRRPSEPSLAALSKEVPLPLPLARKKKANRIYKKELTLAFLLLTASARSLLSVQGIHFYFLLFQGIAFLVVGLDLIGEQAA